jgi:hypothetical protein
VKFDNFETNFRRKRHEAPHIKHWTYHCFFWYTIISYHFPKKRYIIIYIISRTEWYDRISYIIFLSFQKKLKLAIFYILFINNQSSKHTKWRSQLSLIIFYSNNGHKLTSKSAVKSTQASNLWRGNLNHNYITHKKWYKNITILEKVI